MGTRGVITEDQLMSAMPRNRNPNLGFRGNPDGVQGRSLIDYGVYAAPLQRALARYGYQSETLSYATRADVKAYIDRGWPVVAWITYRLQPAIPRLGTANGTTFILVPHEHAVLIIGYDATTVIANDPWTRKQVRYWWTDFERSWGLFGRIGLAIEPCPEPLPVQQVRVTGMDASGLTWAWSPARNAAQYAVTVKMRGPKNRVVFHGVQVPHRFTLTYPTPGASYVITVQSLSSCGGLATPIQQWVTVPTVLPTPTPQPGTTTQTPVPTRTAAATASATPVGTRTIG
jgi:uncharacterized protein YvpB